MEKETKFCTNCGEEIDIRAEICPKCGVRQSPPPSETVGKTKKGLPKWAIAIIIIIVLAGIGAMMGGDGYSSSNGKIGISYKWIEMQSIDFDTEDTFIDLIFEEVYDEFTLPEDAVEWKAEVTWKGGDKDSYIKITFWRYGETDDVNIGDIYENSKQGEETFTYDKVDKGLIYFVEASAIHNLYGTIKIYAKVPE
jgi:hypothetical protein